MGRGVGRLLGAGVTRFPRLILLFTLVLAGLSGWGVTKVGLETDYRMFFSERNPDLANFKAFEERYGREDIVVFVLKRKSGSVLAEDFYTHIEAYTEAAGKIPHAVRVQSLSTVFADYPPAPDVAAQREAARSDPLLKDRFLSDDASATAIFVQMTLPGEGPNEVETITAAARDLAAQMHAERGDYDYAVTGSVVLNAAIMETSLRDGVWLFPALALIILGVLFFFFRALLPVWIVLVTVTLSSVAALGLGGWAGLSLNVASAVAPTIVLTLAIADCIHLLVGAARGEGEGLSRAEAVARSVTRNFRPIVITSLTTAVGFLALNFSDAPPIQTLGQMTALGVMAALVLGLILVPTLAVIFSGVPLKGRGVTLEGWRKWKGAAFVRLLMRLSIVIILLVSLLTGWAAYKAAQMPINDEMVDYFDPSVKFRQDTEFAQEHLVGLNVLEFSMPSFDEDGIYGADYLEAVDKFAAWLRTQDRVVSVWSLPSLFKQMDSMYGGEGRLPEDADSALLMLTYADIGGSPSISSLVDEKSGHTRVSAMVRSAPTMEMLTLKRKSEAWLAENYPQGDEIIGTGWTVMFAELSVRNVKGMIAGTALTILVVSVMLVLFFGSVRLAGLALLVNIVPLVLTYGLWGAARGQFSLAASVAAAVAVGILVDFSIHILSRYNWARKDRGDTREEAVHFSYEEVGAPIFVITLTLVMGFAILYFSHFGFNRSLGLMTALSVSLAFLTNLLLLPALLRRFTKA